MTAEHTSPGQIMTFYSYKGGTGRSMALANIACLLAQQWASQENILMIDWDLEAPGLQQYFRHRFSNSNFTQGILPSEQLGLIDLFYEIKSSLEKNEYETDIPDIFFDNLDIPKYTAKLKFPLLSLMPAGRLDDGMYSSRVNSFNWDEFFNKHPSAITQFANYLRKKYKYILIDSRTGYTDISGICTSLMPEKLIVVFTPNRQSITGALELVKKSIDYRKQSDDLRPLIVFPLVSRVENAESKLQKDWRFGNPSEEISGYQPQFESVFKDSYALPTCDLTKYFDDVQIQYVPRYSYGEEIAVISERAEDRLSIASSYERCTEKLVELEYPWEILEQGTLTEAYPLTDREKQVLKFMADGYSDKQIANSLNLSNNTVKTIVRVILRKLDALNRTEATVKAIRNKII